MLLKRLIKLSIYLVATITLVFSTKGLFDSAANRQTALAGASGFPSFAQEFDPYGSNSGFVGRGSSHYRFAGEWIDSAGLQYLRARYYSPAQGRFISRDPFPGMIDQPASLNPYSYALNNPVLYTDPSGEFVLPFVAAAAIGGVISAGADVVGQMLAMGPGDFGAKLRCVDWGQVGISFAAGAVAGFAGFTVFGGVTALLGTGFLANVAAGALSGVVAGQYGNLTYLALSGQIDQSRGSLFRWQDVVRDAALGGIGGGISYGLQRGLSGIAQDILQSLTNKANAKLAANPGVARSVLSQAEYKAGQNYPSVARLEYGNAVERMVGNQIGESVILRHVFRHLGGANKPDIVGKSIFSELQFDITTPVSIPSHLSRPYGSNLIFILYSRPNAFTLFP